MARDSLVVGVIGGGQLAGMLWEAALPLALDLRVLARRPDDPVVGLLPDAQVGDCNDPGTLRRFAAGCDVVTVEHELVEPMVLETLAATTAVRPGPAVLAVVIDKAEQRRRLRGLGIPLPPHLIAVGASQLIEAGHELGWPVVAKVARGGYDGRGVEFVDGPEDMVALARRVPDDAVFVVEPHLALDGEIAVQVVRGADGALVTYPVVRTVQTDGICRFVTAPAAIDERLRRQAAAIAGRIAEDLGVIGVLAVELFVVNGTLVVNELAARPHNTGHYTIEACTTSQFANHLRAVCGLPLGAPDLMVPAAAMVNIIASTTDPLDRRGALAHPAAQVHLYGKAPRPGRKVGHVTVCGADPDEALDHARRAVADLETAGATA
jgi:5-(carboxyamino)imidazole ribonucleotide synthase